MSGVTVTDTASAVSAQTNESGQYSITVPSANPAHLRFEKGGFEPAEIDQMATGLGGDARMQKVIRIMAGESVMPDRLAPNDLSYDVGGARCHSCRLIHIVVPEPGTLQLRLTWISSTVTLGLWIDGRHLAPAAAGVEIGTTLPAQAGELILYIDRVTPPATTEHVTFTLATAFTAS